MPVIDWLHEASGSAVARLPGPGWNTIDGIMRRAVEPEMARGAETSFRKRHDCVTVVTDTDQGHVVHASDGRKKESLAARYDSLMAERPEAIESAGMDMWPANINATTGRISDAAEKIAFDRFHVVSALIDAVDKVRRREHGSLLQQGDTSLTGTRYA